MAGARIGTDIELMIEGDGAVTKATAYHAVSARGHGRGVLLLGDSPGLGDFARDACDRLARAGFVALAPELEGGEDAIRAAEAGVRRLLDDGATDGARVGALGFGAGGALALALAAASPRVGAVVDCYGVPGEMPPGTGVGADTPVLLVFGERDPRVQEGLVRELERALGSARVELAPEAGDGFMDPVRADRFVAGAAAAGWDAILAFLGGVP
jgi:carboxymethylenebutenolidase